MIYQPGLAGGIVGIGVGILAGILVNGVLYALINDQATAPKRPKVSA